MQPNKSNKPYIFLRALKHAEHTVFCVADGQKTYYDPQFGKTMAYSSGQQVKHSILESMTDYLKVPMAPITFNYEITKKKELSQKEPWSPCDPTYVDQLVGGWMRAGDGITKKRRSPLSISALRPLHPLLARVSKELATFDRSERPEQHPVNVRIEGKSELLTEEEITAFLQDTGRSIPRRNLVGESARATGLFVYDIAIDLRTLFSVSTNQHDPEITPEMIEKLRSEGWIEGQNVFGSCLILPKERREEVIPALAHALLNWRIGSNQSRTFSLMETLAVAISDNANAQAGAIRAKLIDDDDTPKAKPIIDEQAGAEVFVTLPCASYIVVEHESADALKAAEERLIELMRNFDYEQQ